MTYTRILALLTVVALCARRTAAGRRQHVERRFWALREKHDTAPLFELSPYLRVLAVSVRSSCFVVMRTK